MSCPRSIARPPRIRTIRAIVVIMATVVIALLGVSAAAAQLDRKLEALENAVAGLYDGRPVTVEECVSVAQVGSVTLGGFEEDLESARIDKWAAWFQWLPNLTMSARWNRQERTDKDVPVAIDPVTGDVLATGDQTITQTFESETLSASWTVFSGFARIAEQREAAAKLRAAEANLDYQESVLRESVTNAYYDLLRAQQRVQVAMDAEELARQELERSETYFDLGISTRSDVLQAKVRLQQTKLDTVRERNAARNAFAALAHAMNIPSARPFEVDPSLPDIDAGSLPSLEDLVARAKQRRRDLEAAQWQLDAAGSAITRARAGALPSIEVFGSAGRNVSETPFRFGAQENSTVTWGIQGNWAIFDRFRTKQQVRQAVASRRRAEYALRQAELDTELEIVQLHNNLVEAIESQEVSEVTVEQSQEDLRLAKERFRVGAGTALDVITAQVNLAQARRDLVDAQVNYVKILSQLERAVGGPLR